MKKTKKILAMLLCLGLMSSLAACGGDGGSTSDTPEGSKTEGSGDHTINIWCWDSSESRTQMHQDFTDEMGIKVEITAVESADMAQKLQTTMASGGVMPDIAWCEATYRGALLNLGIWEDITKDPYNFDTSLVLDYLVDLETSVDGQYIGPECPSVAGLAYKRDLALQYFGTDDPEEMEKIFTSWDVFLEKGQEVQEASNGEVFMFPSLGSLGIILKGQGTEPFITGTEITFENSMKPILTQLAEFSKAGVIDVLDYSSAEEGASYADDKHIFYPCANWSIEFTIKANDADGKDRWGFMLPPGGGFAMGGTVMAVPSNAQNKEDAVTYIKYFFQDERGANLQLQYKGNFSPLKTIYESDDIFYTKEEEWFAGQDVLADIQTKVLPNITAARIPVPYDQDIDDVYNLACKSINAAKGDIDIDELLGTMADELITNSPELTRAN
jgi:multiple sugar transport system substrate-binding protein